MYVDFAWLVDNGYIAPESDPTRINTLIRLTQSWLERLTGRIFEPYEWSYRIDAPTTKIFAPNPIQSVTSLVIYKQNIAILNNGQGYGLPDRDHLAGTDDLYKQRAGLVNYPILTDFASPVIEGRSLAVQSSVYGAEIVNKQFPQYPDDCFYLQLNFEPASGESIGYVVATIGYLEFGETPLNIKHAMGELVSWRYKDPAGYRESLSGRGLLSETTDGHTYTLSQASISQSITGNQEIDDIILLYKRKSRSLTAKLV